MRTVIRRTWVTAAARNFAADRDMVTIDNLYQLLSPYPSSNGTLAEPLRRTDRLATIHALQTDDRRVRDDALYKLTTFTFTFDR